MKTLTLPSEQTPIQKRAYSVRSGARRSKLFRVGTWLAATGLLVIAVAAMVTQAKRRMEIQTVSDEQKIARSLEIIRTSTPTDRKVLRVLFYGQSITRSGWHKSVVEHWRQNYPYTDFEVQNRALGGFASQALVRATEQDIQAFYPDLIIFHVYGDHRAYERIIRLIRSLTAADVIVQTDHGEALPDPPCTEGLQMTLRRQPGCSGVGWVHQRLWNDEMSYHKIPAFANKYGLAFEPQRDWWRDYLVSKHVEPRSLLEDDVHPNVAGKELIAQFFNRYFDNLIEHWNGETGNNVVSFPANSIENAGGQNTFQFDGNRLELLSKKTLASWPAATVDGVSPKDIDGCYQVTRASSIRTVPDWPAVRRITVRRDHTPQDWTATLVNLSPDQKAFDFTVKGSVTGADGYGSSGSNFVSNSGRFSIEADDWMVERAFQEKHIPLQAPLEAHWSLNYVCGGEPEIIGLGDGSMQYRYVIATGLPNGKHTVKLSSLPGGRADVTEFRAYRPPLHEK